MARTASANGPRTGFNLSLRFCLTDTLCWPTLCRPTDDLRLWLAITRVEFASPRTWRLAQNMIRRTLHSFANTVLPVQLEGSPVPRVEGSRGVVQAILLPGSNLASNRLPGKSDRTDLPAANSEPVRSVELGLTVAEAELIQLALAMALPKMGCYLRENGQSACT